MDSPHERLHVVTTTRHRWLVVALFTFAFAFAYLDRQVLTLLIDPIRHSIGLNDTQVGLLQGFAFALCFAVGGVPLGWLIDNWNRTRVASACVALWSLSTVSSGIAASYSQLLAVRSITALSEAGCSPAALSIFADIFPPRLLPRVTAIYTAAPYFGGGASLFAGGYLLARFNRTSGLDIPWLGHLLPWQAVFVVIGMPGLLLALLILLCLCEPARREGDKLAGGTIRLRDVLRFIGRDSGYLPAYFGAYACILAAFFSLITWYPTLAIRSAFGSAASLGPKLGVTFLVCGLMGSVSAQWFVGRAGDAQIVQRVMRLASWFIALQLPASLILARAASIETSIIGYAVMVFAIGVLTSLMPIPLQVGVPNRMRGRVIGLFIFGVNVVGTGAGPVLVGSLSDALGNTAKALSAALPGVLLACSCAAFFCMRYALKQLLRKQDLPSTSVVQPTDVSL
ncbi:MFS transporter [Caballeronia sp. 15711]|uniref:MFS transporter n=1 Tax=Caballeronia sp. 15711 TaxID=3391029 RepID=UPI0039E62E9C